MTPQQRVGLRRQSLGDQHRPALPAGQRPEPAAAQDDDVEAARARRRPHQAPDQTPAALVAWPLNLAGDGAFAQ
jgi:hypothetical protein